MTKWTFLDYANQESEIPVRIPVNSADHAVELLMEHSGWTEYGIVLEFVHADKGLIRCIANTEFSTLEFNPDFSSNSRSRVGSRVALRIKPVSKDPFYFVSGGQASSMPLCYVLPIIKVVRAVKHIIEHDDFPGGIRWSDPAPAAG